MKKILLTLAIAGAALSSAFAQGTVFAINGAGLLVSTNGTATGGGVGVTQGTGFYYALFIDGSTPSSSNPLTGGWTFSGTMMTNISAGALSGGAAAVVNGWTPNTFFNYEIVGWSTDGGAYSTWAQVAAAFTAAGAGANALTGAGLQGGTFYGVSTTGNAEPGGGSPALGVWHLFGTTASGQGTPVGGFQLAQVPEPTSMALAALGGASLLMYRRKK